MSGPKYSRAYIRDLERLKRIQLELEKQIEEQKKEQLLEDIRNVGTNVYILSSPYHPAFFKKMLKKKGVVEAFDFVESYAKKNNIPLISSYNPEDEGLTDSDFYDGPHVRKEILDNIIERELFK